MTKQTPEHYRFSAIVRSSGLTLSFLDTLLYLTPNEATTLVCKRAIKNAQDFGVKLDLNNLTCVLRIID